MKRYFLPLPPEVEMLLPGCLHALCETARYAKGSVLFEVGKRPTSMFYVSAGEVTLQRHGVQGEPVILLRTRHGFVGEASLQSDRYHCDAMAVADSEVTRIPLRELLDALKSDPPFALRWISTLNREVRRLRLQCERLSLNTVEARLVHLLETDGGAFGFPLGAGLKSIAREIGVTHEALYRCVARLERQNVLRRDEEHLCLVSDGKRGRASPVAESGLLASGRLGACG
jgi:CRP/FNR family transcriptional regulator, dissimilatory nitrate respiration regulator